ncbi:MAG: galactosyldiacylglycerol synthase, partial [Chloroflexota bacterium]
PGQEAGNARFVVESGAGAWSPGPIGVLTTAYAWLAKDALELKERQAAARRVGRPRAAYHIAELLVGQIE